MPEIALTPHLVSRVEAAVSEPVVALHSALSEADRRDGLQLLREGRARIVVGAVFAPTAQPFGLIIVDEEHEPSLKQDDLSPRYHGKDVALWRTDAEGAVCVLGSATPSLESRHNVATGKLVCLLPTRVGGGGALPDVLVVDLRHPKGITIARKKDRYPQHRRPGRAGGCRRRPHRRCPAVSSPIVPKARKAQSAFGSRALRRPCIVYVFRVI